MKPEGPDLVDQPGHPLREPVERARHLLFHYPELHPDAFKAGREEVQEALARRRGETGVVEVAGNFAGIRAWFADDVALNMVVAVEPAEEDAAFEDLLSRMVEPMTALMRVAEAALATYLQGLGSFVPDDGVEAAS